jgi:cell division protein FtsN
MSKAKTFVMKTLRLSAPLSVAFFAAILLFGCSKPPAEAPREVSERVKIEEGAPIAEAGHEEGVKLETVAVKELPGDAVKHMDEGKPPAPKPEEPKAEKPKVTWIAKKTEALKEAPKKAEPAKEAVKKPEPVKATAKAEPAKTIAKPVAKPVATADAKKLHIVNVASFTGKAKADEIMGILARRGDNVYMMEFVKDKQTWYRVRVGFFDSFSKASAYAKKVSSHPDMKDAWVTRPTPEEAARYFK